jgi:uncharacterized protein (TIGR02996 family)
VSHEAFLGPINANPDDDTARLIYADWLEDTGKPADALRAEFIRLQYEVDPRLHPGPVRCTCKAVISPFGHPRKRGSSPKEHEPGCGWLERYLKVARMQEILDAPCRPGFPPNKVEWFTGLLIDHDRFRPTYRRGFAEEILWRDSLLMPEVPWTIDAILKLVPTVRVMHVEEAPVLRIGFVRQVPADGPWYPGPIARAMTEPAESIEAGLARPVTDTIPEGFVRLVGLPNRTTRGAWVRATDSPASPDTLDRILKGTWPQIREFKHLWRTRDR